MTQILHWNDFSLKDEMFHVAGLSSDQTHEAGEHTHEGFAECILVISGRLKHLINGEEKVLRAGQFVMIRPEDRHDFRAVRAEKFSFRNVAFRTTTLDYINNRYFPNQSDFWGADCDASPLWTLEGSALQRMELRIARLMTRPRKKIYIEQFLLDVLTDAPTQQNHFVSVMPDWLENACAALNHPSEFSAGISALFRLAGRSPEHVSRELKRCTGETPTGLVNRLRLEHAARRLLLSGKDITTIAYDCGFETLSYFSGRFKKQFGLTPRDYRKKHRAPVFGG
jgi:AraC family transcriptional regulator, dual regulator of chb operon